MSPGRAEQDRLGRIGFPIAAFVLPLVVYLLTWCRDIFRLDTTESMLSGICLRLPHPPGYPLLILLLRLVSLVPILGTPLRMNMAAALFAALTWGLSSELWQQATALEVYSLQALIISAVLFCLADWSRTTSQLSSSSAPGSHGCTAGTGWWPRAPVSFFSPCPCSSSFPAGPLTPARPGRTGSLRAR